MGNVRIKTARNTATVQTPYGPKEVTVDGGYFTTIHRGERLTQRSLEALLTALDKTDAEAEERAEIARRRKALAKDPVQACYLAQAQNIWVGRKIGSYSRVIEQGTKRHVPAHIERITIRGTDQRSGYALVTRADGEKESMNWNDILRPLSESDEADILAAVRVAERAKQAAEEAPSGGKIAEILEEDIRLEAVFDFATGAYSTIFENQPLTGPTDRDLVEQVHAIVAKRAGYRYVEIGKGNAKFLVRIGDRLPGYSDVYFSTGDYRAEQEAAAEVVRTQQILRDTLKDYAFDRTLVAGVETV